ncbi:MAG: Crp/Fnr family transcriptional regulator [Eubacteriales bacterium]|nr:Crp/Fnr family transcriptional regulator [Eubacteriales bacterium]
MQCNSHCDAHSHCCSSEHETCIELVPIFKGLNEEEMLEIAGITSSRILRKGELAYGAGEVSNTMYVVHKGKIKLYRLTAGGKEQVLQIIGPGEFIGELTLFSSLPLSDFAEAMEETTLCVLEGSKLKELMGKYPQIAFKVMDELSRRLENAESRIEAISLGSVAERLAAAIVDLAAEEAEVELPMTKGDLASQLGMSQEALSRKLTEFQDEGLITLQGQRRIIINDRTELESIANKY